MTTRTELATISPAATDRRGPGGTGDHQAAGLSTAGLVTVLLGAALPIIDFFIVNVALPTIDSDLHASTTTLELVVAGYGIAYALLLVIGGRLGDAFGRRKLFLIGLAAFTVTSLACGLAPTAIALVAARAAQGAAAAMMLPQVLSTIQATTTGERRSSAIGMYGATGGICTVIGQLLGGLLVAANVGDTSWRPIFLVNVPIGLVALLLGLRTVPETRSANPAGVDRLGTGILGVGLLALLVPLTEGRALGWPWWAWLSLAVVPFAGAAFVTVERRAEQAGRTPLLPPSIMRLPSMRRGLSLAVPFFAGFGGFMFVYAVTLQEGLHLGPAGSGFALTPMAVSFFATSLVSSRLVTRFGTRVVPIGLLLQAAGITLLVLATLLYWPHLGVLQLAPGMFVAGIGMSMTMTTLFRVILSQVPVERAGVGSGAMVTTQQTSLALGVATLGTLFASWSAPTELGMRNAFAVVMLIQLVIAVGLAAAGRKLPETR